MTSEEGEWVTLSLANFLEQGTKQLEVDLPAIVGKYRRTSDATIDYNCIAWAVGVNDVWFDPARNCIGYFWPEGVRREWSMSAISQILELYGYTEPSLNSDLESGFLKIAVYADADGAPTHAARQLASGDWASKLGEQIDIEHNGLECLSGDEPYYGNVVLIVKKRI